VRAADDGLKSRSEKTIECECRRFFSASRFQCDVTSEVRRIRCRVENVAEYGGIDVGCFDSCSLDRCFRSNGGEIRNWKILQRSAVSTERSSYR
jgi:hypothetical protein